MAAMVLLCGCTANRQTATAQRPLQLAAGITGVTDDTGTYPVAYAAWLDGRRRIVIRYRWQDADAMTYAEFPEDYDGSQTARAARPTPPTVLLGPQTAPRPPTNDAIGLPIHAVDDWHHLVALLASRAAGLVDGEGIVLDLLQMQELLLHLDTQGHLRAYPLVDAPAWIRPSHTLTFEQLLIDGMDTVRRASPTAQQLLFNTGDPAFPFALLLPQESHVLFLQMAQAGDRHHGIYTAPLYTAQATTQVLTGQVVSAATRPMSTLSRFLSGMSSGAIDQLPRRRDWDPGLPPPAVDAYAQPMDPVTWEAELDNIAPGSRTSGSLDLLVGGAEFFPALIHAIGNARAAIRIRLYIFDNDDYAVKIADRLKSRSEDIAIEILLDGLGTVTAAMKRPQSGARDSMTQPASIADYLRQDSMVRVRTLSNPWLQGDHSKVLLFDDRLAFLGGMNIGREYRYEWHDLMAALEGPVVGRLVDDFERAWGGAGLLGDLGAALPRQRYTSRERAAGEYPLRLLYTLPGDSQILNAQIAAMHHAQQRIWIENAYLTSDRILDELIAARRRGIDVRVILPYRTDAGFIGRSNVLAANQLLQHGVRVFIYPGMSHVKAAVYDGWACFGSANFDRLSLRLNRETNIATSDPEAVGMLVDRVFEPDFARAAELDAPLPANWLDYLKEVVADQF